MIALIKTDSRFEAHLGVVLVVAVGTATCLHIWVSALLGVHPRVQVHKNEVSCVTDGE